MDPSRGGTTAFTVNNTCHCRREDEDPIRGHPTRLTRYCLRTRHRDVEFPKGESDDHIHVYLEDLVIVAEIGD